MAEHFISRGQAETDLLSAATFLAENIKSSDGHAEAMRAIVPMYLGKGEVDLAAELANQIDEPFARDKLLTEIAIKCAGLDDDEYALQLAGAIDDVGLRSQAFESVAMVKSNKDQFAKAREIAASMTHPDYVHVGIAVGEARVGNTEAADQAIGDIEFPDARVAALQHMAAAANEKKEHDRAVALLDRAVLAVGEIGHDEERIRSFCEIGSLFLDAKRNDKAIAAYDQARAGAEELDNVHRDHFLGTAALGFLFAGSEDLCDRALDLVMDKTQMSSALVGMARYEWQNDKKEDALESLDEAYQILKSQKDFETRDSKARNALMTSIAVQFASFGESQRAIDIAEENADPEEEAAGLSQIAQILTMQKKDELARQAVTAISDDAGRLPALIGMADVQFRLNESEAGLQMLEEAAALSDSVQQLASRSGAMNDIADRLFEHGATDRAREIVVENLGAISQIKDESSQSVAVAGIAAVYATRGIDMSETEAAAVKALVDHSL